MGGTRYSFLEHVPFKTKTDRGVKEGVASNWDLKRLGGARRGTNYAPRSTREIFLQVVTDCKGGAL
jgi:hypothetical protein